MIEVCSPDEAIYCETISTHEVFQIKFEHCVCIVNIKHPLGIIRTLDLHTEGEGAVYKTFVENPHSWGRLIKNQPMSILRISILFRITIQPQSEVPHNDQSKP
jgi:hypothetical protein